MSEEMQAITPAKAKIETLRQLLEKAKPSMKAVIPQHVTPERLIKLALVAASRNPRLLNCTPQSIVQCVMTAAEMGLELGGAIGAAYPVPYRNSRTGQYEAQFIPGYRGLIDLARRSGEVDSIGAWPVYEKDSFDYSVTDEGEKLKHTPPPLGQDRGALTGVYAIARLKGTPLPKIEVMTKAQVDAIRGRSRAANDGPWVTDYDEMARKTAIRRIVKYLPLSIERIRPLAKALELEDRVEAGESPMEAIEVTAAEESPDTNDLPTPPEVPSKTEEIKAKLKGNKALPEASNA